MHTGDPSKFAFKMQYCDPCRILRIEETKGTAQQIKKFRLAVFAIGANLNEFDKIRRRLHPWIILTDSGKRVFHDDFRQSVEIRTARRDDRYFRLKKKIELACERCFGAASAFGDRLDASPGFRAPGDDQAGIAELPFPQQDRGCRFHPAI